MKTATLFLNRLTVAFLITIVFLATPDVIHAQSWNLTGNAGITTSNFIGTTDNKDLIFKVNNKDYGRLVKTGFWRLGNATNYAKIDSTGKLSFNGSGSYLVGKNKYVFQYLENNNYGLFFNGTMYQYEFLNGNGHPVFTIDSAGTGIFSGKVKIGNYTLPNNDGSNGQVLKTNGAGVLSWSTISSGANRTLSNLTSPTSINIPLQPNNTNSIDLGSFGKSWKDVFITGKLFINGQAFISNSDGYNTFIGVTGNTTNTGGFNTATGVFALLSNVTGSGNTAVGYGAALGNTNGNSNTAVGTSAMSYCIGNSNTALGAHALLLYNTGSYNTAVGENSLSTVFHGSYNTVVGYAAGGSDESLDNSIAIGAYATANAHNQAVIGSPSITSIGGYENWTNFSDGRYKQNLKQNVPGLSFINKLKPVTYTLNANAIDAKLHMANQSKASNIKRDVERDAMMQQSLNEKSKIVYTGFVAQEVAEAAEELNYNFRGVDKPQKEDGFYGLRYSDFVVPLVKAVQELSKENDALKKQNDSLNARLSRIEKLLHISPETVYAASENIQQVELNATSTLEQNIPNPFTNSTTIHYYLPANSNNAYINFYNTSGALMKSVKLNGDGKGTLQLKANQLPVGTYQYSLFINGQMMASKKMILIK